VIGAALCWAGQSRMPTEVFMPKNIGDVDKVIRVVIGLALLSLVFLVQGNARWWGLIGLGPILTVVLGWCPGYSLIGVSTRKHAKS
jgi:Inner membrane protein YgaP-like, transmembrane domain